MRPSAKEKYKLPTTLDDRSNPKEMRDGKPCRRGIDKRSNNGMHRQAGMENMKIRSELRAEIEMHARSKASFSPTPKTLNLPIPEKQIKKTPTMNDKRHYVSGRGTHIVAVVM